MHLRMILNKKNIYWFLKQFFLRCWLVVVSKTKIIKRDKKIETNRTDDGGAAWLLLLLLLPPLNIIPKKSPPSSLLDPSVLPLLVAPVTVPPPLKPGYKSPLSLFNNLLIRTLKKVPFFFWFGRHGEKKKANKMM